MLHKELKYYFSCCLTNTVKKTTAGVTLNIKLTHQNISDMTGMIRETVTMVIDKWQKNAEITILKNKFIRLGPDFLQKDLKVVI
jgi:CRP-like cAMP-binding protein